jgi:vacuolar protein sorting-associated protein IST1
MDIRKHLTAKYGKEFVSAAVELRPDCGVSRLVSFFFEKLLLC